MKGLTATTVAHPDLRDHQVPSSPNPKQVSLRFRKKPRPCRPHIRASDTSRLFWMPSGSWSLLKSAPGLGFCSPYLAILKDWGSQALSTVDCCDLPHQGPPRRMEGYRLGVARVNSRVHSVRSHLRGLSGCQVNPRRRRAPVLQPPPHVGLRTSQRCL